jgi:hypothetical protein
MPTFLRQNDQGFLGGVFLKYLKYIKLLVMTFILMSPAISDEVEKQINNLTDSDHIVRVNAILDLSELNDSRAVEPLIQVLKDDPSTREMVLKVLGRFKDPKAVDALVNALEDKNLRKSAAFALGEQNDSRAVEPLIQVLSEDGKSSRRTAAYLLGEMRDPRAIEPLTQALNDEDRAVQEGAALALTKLGKPTGYASGVITTDEEGNPIAWGIFQLKPFQFRQWGRYARVDLNGTRYFAAYYYEPINEIPSEPYLYYISKEINLTAKGYLSEVLIDGRNSARITLSQPLKLREGYELCLKSIDGLRADLELRKNGQTVDSKVVAPGKGNPTMVDQTYYYRRDLGDTKNIVLIAVHFKDAEAGTALVDGIFQISDTLQSLTDLGISPGGMRLASNSSVE